MMSNTQTSAQGKTMLSRFTALEIAAGVRAGRCTARAVTQQALDEIRVRGGAFNAFVDVTHVRAFAEADRIDALVASGRDPGPLAGVPYAVKNLFDVQGLPTLAGSRINRERPAAACDATLVERLAAAGAVLLGTLNMDEYAFGFTTENTHYGATRNPHDLRRIAGGSSGGSAAAVAARLIPLSLGSDTNGSIRVPASYCGVFGMKPTFGGLSRAGTFPFVASLDHVGPFARSVSDLAAIYDVLRGPDVRDPVCRADMPPALSPQLEAGIHGLRIARLGGWFEEQAQPEVVALVRHAAQALECGMRCELAEVARARAAAFVITACEGAHLHLPNLRERAHDFDPLIRDRLLANALIPSSWYLQAQALRRWFRREVLRCFERFDVLLAPATTSAAHPIGTDYFELRGRTLPARPNIGLLTQPISCIGLPVVAAPMGTVPNPHDPSRPLPVGMQVIAAPGREDHCLRVARALERARIAICPEPVWN
jgi:AtzE family amidohydrolase